MKLNFYIAIILLFLAFGCGASKENLITSKYIRYFNETDFNNETVCFDISVVHENRSVFIDSISDILNPEIRISLYEFNGNKGIYYEKYLNYSKLYGIEIINKIKDSVEVVTSLYAEPFGGIGYKSGIYLENAKVFGQCSVIVVEYNKLVHSVFYISTFKEHYEILDFKLLNDHFLDG